MLRINLYGGPGVGKSTLAARIYAQLQQDGFTSVELVREFVKPWAYEKRRLTVCDQVFAFANQLWNEERMLQAGVKVVITDSPILLQCFYTEMLNLSVGWGLEHVAYECTKFCPTLDFLVRRYVPYTPEGRYQTVEEVDKLDNYIERRLNELALTPVCPVFPSQFDTFYPEIKNCIEICCK